MYSGDRCIGAVPLGLGRDSEDQDRSDQRTPARDEWNRPRSCKVGGCNSASLADGLWNRVASKNLEEDVRRKAQCLVKDDGTEPRDDADNGSKYEPLLGVGRGG